MELRLENLRECFNGAIRCEAEYVAVKVSMQGFAEPEIIINKKENFVDKLAYYEKAYNQDLTLKAFNGIKIIAFTYGRSFEQIESDLIWSENFKNYKYRK